MGPVAKGWRLAVPLRILPNAEGVLIAFLKSDPDVAPLLGDRVYSALPATKTWPAARVTRYAGAPVFQQPVELDRAEIQVDVWATSKQSAWQIAATMRAAVAARLPGVWPLGVVTGVDLGQFTYDADETYDPALPRYITDLTVYARPA